MIKEGQPNLQADPGAVPGAAAGKVLRETKAHEPTAIREQLSIKTWQHQQPLLASRMGPGFSAEIPV